ETRADALRSPLDLQRTRHDPAYAPDLLPFPRQSIIAPRLRNLGEDLQVNRAVLGRIAREPRLLCREREDRRQPDRQAVEGLVQHRQGGPPLLAGVGLAVERILADVEVERRQIVGAEVRQRVGYTLEVVVLKTLS